MATILHAIVSRFVIDLVFFSKQQFLFISILSTVGGGYLYIVIRKKGG